DAPRRVGEHLEHVVFGPWVRVRGTENSLLVPYLLPARLGLAGVVALRGHRLRSDSGREKSPGLGHERRRGVNRPADAAPLDGAQSGAKDPNMPTALVRAGCRRHATRELRGA